MGVIKDFKRQAEIENAERDRELRRQRAESMKQKSDIRAAISQFTFPSRVAHYNEWINGYVKKGGKPTHSYDYPMERLDYRTAHSDFHLPAGYGAYSVHVIVPVGIKVTFDQLGHNSIYFMDGYRVEGSFVPVFSDTEEAQP